MNAWYIDSNPELKNMYRMYIRTERRRKLKAFLPSVLTRNVRSLANKMGECGMLTMTKRDTRNTLY